MNVHTPSTRPRTAASRKPTRPPTKRCSYLTPRTSLCGTMTPSTASSMELPTLRTASTPVSSNSAPSGKSTQMLDTQTNAVQETDNYTLSYWKEKFSFLFFFIIVMALIGTCAWLEAHAEQEEAQSRAALFSALQINTSIGKTVYQPIVPTSPPYHLNMYTHGTDVVVEVSPTPGRYNLMAGPGSYQDRTVMWYKGQMPTVTVTVHAPLETGPVVLSHTTPSYASDSSSISSSSTEPQPTHTTQEATPGSQHLIPRSGSASTSSSTQTPSPITPSNCTAALETVCSLILWYFCCFCIGLGIGFLYHLWDLRREHAAKSAAAAAEQGTV